MTNVVISDPIPAGLSNCAVEATSSTNTSATITPS